MRYTLEKLRSQIIEIPIKAVGWRWNRHPFLIGIPQTHLLQIFVHPSFDLEHSVDFYEPRSSRGIENIKCVISMTNRRIPASVAPNPVRVPDLIIRRKLVKKIPRIAKQWLVRLPKIKVLLGPFDCGGGLDGTSYEVHIGDFIWGACRFEWWESPPSQWSEIGRMAQEILASLEGEFNKLRA